MYANNNGLEKAIQDFELALKVDPSHQNGRKYMCETLVAVARNHEDDKEVFYGIFSSIWNQPIKYIIKL